MCQETGCNCTCYSCRNGLRDLPCFGNKCSRLINGDGGSMSNIVDDAMAMLEVPMKLIIDDRNKLLRENKRLKEAICEIREMKMISHFTEKEWNHLFDILCRLDSDSQASRPDNGSVGK